MTITPEKLRGLIPHLEDAADILMVDGYKHRSLSLAEGVEALRAAADEIQRLTGVPSALSADTSTATAVRAQVDATKARLNRKSRQ